MRELNVHLLPGDRAEKFHGLLADKLGLEKLKHVTKRSVVTRSSVVTLSDGGFHIDLIREVAGSLEELSITFDTFVLLPGAVSVICLASSLRKLIIRVDIPLHLQQPDPGAGPFEPLVRHLGTLATFETFRLDLLGLPSIPLAQYRSWPSLLLDHPVFAERLDSLAIKVLDLPEWEGARLGSVRSVRIEFAEQPDAEEVQRVRDAFPGCTSLALDMASTKDLLGFPLADLRELVLHECFLELKPEQFPAVESLMSSSGMTVRLEPDWRNHEEEVIVVFDDEDGDDAARMAYAAVAALRAEEAFWLGLKGATVDRYGDWEVFLSDVAHRQDN
ncbi:hypothetical protein DFJ74DRAFT_705318 [Hyaloraphidium curvatum]|nr:hypothetical protein DFJ74DRAFT_705318 [Hyaloraphidium curvatum]